MTLITRSDDERLTGDVILNGLVPGDLVTESLRAALSRAEAAEAERDIKDARIRELENILANTIRRGEAVDNANNLREIHMVNSKELDEVDHSLVGTLEREIERMTRSCADRTAALLSVESRLSLAEKALRAIADSPHFSEFMRAHSPEERDHKFAEEVPEYGKDCDEIHSVAVKIYAALKSAGKGRK